MNISPEKTKKLTPGQLREKENLEWFCGGLLRQWPPHKGEFEEYLEYSERGTKMKGFEHGHTPHYNPETFISQKFNVWAEAKRRRAITIHELWEADFYGRCGWLGIRGILTEEDGTPIPEHIKDYIKNEIFRGTQAAAFDDEYMAIRQELGAT